MRALRTLLALLLFVVYLRLPFDLLPDRFGSIGFLDDLALLAFLLWWLRTKQSGAERRPAEDALAEKPWDPYRVLGVPRQATQEQMARAYREALKRYHPDRVADLGEELQRLAHQKTLEIQRAYRELTGR